uniref:Uncharacterized protein n=1 Tax=viral metagenome TaxID=1070528 RepID=A0A6C0ENY0_9ZZZZ
MKLCKDCQKPLSKYAKYEPIERCRNCANKYSYSKRLPTIKCKHCGKDEKVTSFNQLYCKACMQDIEVLRKRKKEMNRTILENKPHEVRARIKAYNNIKIIKGTLCESCNEKEATQRHHPDYLKPLEVELLCFKCHRLKHKR